MKDTPWSILFQVFPGADILIIDPDFKVDVGTRAAARTADLCDLLALAHLLADLDKQ